nr:PREDICTED: MLO-like protein 10 [Nicotiana tabacum]
MGSNMKKSIFDEQTSKALKKWHMAVKKKAGAKGDKSTRTLGSGSPRSSVGSPLHSSIGPTLHRFKTTGHSTRFNGYDDLEASDLENDPTTPINRPEDSNAQVTDDDTELEVHVPQNEESTRNEDDFSFSKPAPQR